MNPEDLFDKFRNGKSTKEELSILNSWFNSQLEKSLKASNPDKDRPVYNVEENLKSMPWVKPAKTFRLKRTIVAAASILIAFSAAFLTYDYIQRQEEIAREDLTLLHEVVGVRKSQLVLTNGKILPLQKDSMSMEEIIQLSSKKITNEDYSNPSEPELTSIQVPKGSSFKLLLSDGTLVQLNSLSIFSFPSNFEATNRQAYLEGEGYFKVTKDKRNPFILNLTDSIAIEVLGTEFNAKAYPQDHDIEASLIEGSIRLNVIAQNKTYNQIMLPGQTAKIEKNRLEDILLNSSSNNTIDWKDGYFNFNEADIQDIARQISFHYGVQVVVAENIESIQFYGLVERNLTLAGMIDVLKQVGLNCTFEKKTLFIKN